MSEQKEPSEIGKSAQLLHRQTEAVHFSPPPPKKKKAGLAKTSAPYWLPKLRKPARSALFSVQIAHQGQRHRFPLKLSEKGGASEKARDIFMSLVAHGWEATISKYNPSAAPAQKPERVATVGELIAAVKATVDYKPLTFSSYCGGLRHIAAALAEIGDQPDTDEKGKPRKDRRGRPKYLSRKNGKGNKLWLAAVDSVSLDVLTREAVQAWRLAYVDRAGSSPKARAKADVSASSVIRCARSLFTEKALEYVTLKLPDPLPFSGSLKLKKPVSSFKSKLDVSKIIAEAQTELTGEPLKIFLLGLLSGLRKTEIDRLEWAAVDLRQGLIDLAATDHFTAKTERGADCVDLDPELVRLLAAWKAATTGPFVIESDKAPVAHSNSAHYRAEEHFQTVYSWLRTKGVAAQKPLHELRKELGAHLANTQGIYAAQAVMRHAQIATTAAYYSDKKRQIIGGLGALLNTPPPSPDNVVQADFTAAEGERSRQA